MSLIIAALVWLTTPGHWIGNAGIFARILQHLMIYGLALLIAVIIALPLGLIIGHTRKGTGLIAAMTGAARSIPTLGLLTLFGLWLGIGLGAPLLALVVLAIPSLLAGTYSGVQAIDPAIPLAARAIGMNRAQVLLGVELPLALSTIIGGIRAASIQIIATATLAAYTSDVGLGRYLFIGLKTRDYPQMLGAALLVTLLALIVELALSRIQKSSSIRAQPTTAR